MRTQNKSTSSQVNRRRVRTLEARLRRSRERVDKLELRIEQLEKRHEPQRLAGHVYPLQLIRLGVFMVSQANSSLRCAASTVGFLAQMMGWHDRAPVHATIDNWVRRLGLAEMDHQMKDDGLYVGILDETVQIGSEKAMLLLGVKQHEESCPCQPLSFEDIDVLGVEVAQSWKAEEVEDFLDRQFNALTGPKLDYVVCDGGSNLNKALKAKGIMVVSDCSHVLMNLVKKLLKDDKALGRLTKFMGKYRQQNIMSERLPAVPAHTAEQGSLSAPVRGGPVDGSPGCLP